MKEEVSTIYVEIEEGSAIPVFIPVVAKCHGKSFFEILKQNRSDIDSLRFKEGSYVYCLQSTLNNKDEDVLVAYCGVSKEAVAYLTRSET